MRYYELICTAYIKQDIPLRESFEAVSKYISFAMYQDETLKSVHEKRGYKYYSFDNFYPIEKAQVYQRGKTYQFKLRSLDKSFIEKLCKTLRHNIDNPHFLIVDTQKRVITQSFVSELYSLTPVIVSLENALYWTIEKDGDIMKLQKHLHDNLEKKYHDFYDDKLVSTQNFIQLIEIKNRVPQTIWTSKLDANQKRVVFKFFGNKFRIIPQEDEVSQKLAFVALACGLGEKNSYGGGFILGKGLRL